MRTINPGLFTKLMRMPEAARQDLLEFLGATPVADCQLSSMIDSIAEKLVADRSTTRLKSN